jgi:hypothetical protein
MMRRKKESALNRVTLNIPAAPGCERPHADKPIVAIDGKEVERLVEVKLSAGVDQLTMVTLSFFAEVEGDLILSDRTIPEPTETIAAGQHD